MTDDLRGSTPVYSAKDVLLRLDGKIDSIDSKVDQMGTNVAILLSQNLGDRLTAVETWQNRVIGLASSARVLGVVASLLSIASIVVSFLRT